MSPAALAKSPRHTVLSRFGSGLFVLLLAAFLLGSGIAALEHDCTHAHSGHNDSCALCSFSQLAADAAPDALPPLMLPVVTLAPLPTAGNTGYLLPPSADSRAPPLS